MMEFLTSEIREDCKLQSSCEWFLFMGSCPPQCSNYRGADEEVVTRCRECAFGDACSIREAGKFGGNGFCIRGERKVEDGN